MYLKKLITIIFFMQLSLNMMAEVRLFGIFKDNMVLQRDTQIAIWGWASVNEKVEIKFNNQVKSCIASADGSWEVNFPAMTHGGLYNLQVEGQDNSIEISNIAIGDVWICSGQSNMQLPLQLSQNAENIILQANYPQIRLLTIPKNFYSSPQNDFISKWEVCTPKSILDFSAIGFYFAKELHEDLSIPIGIINITYGGTDIETWISNDAFLKLPYRFRYRYNQDLIQSLEEKEKQEQGKIADFLEAMENDFAIDRKWYEPINTTSWDSISVPSSWSYSPLSYVDGHIWFKTFFNKKNRGSNLAGLLSLGSISNKTIWVNGQRVSQSYGNDGQHNLYILSSEILKDGENEITIRISDYGLCQGILGNCEDYFVELFSENESTLIPLSGKWKYKTSVNNITYNIFERSPNMAYSLAYNSMINPITRFPIKGVIWYQGENNVDKANDYKTLFMTLIADWRNKWGCDFPFYWAQLTSYNPVDSLPTESKWAELREAQTAALRIKNTGQAVIYDLGSQTSIHPPRKKEVAQRLALLALNKTYGKRNICSSPMYKSFEVKDNRVAITMDTFGSELVIEGHYNYLKSFSVAGNDRIFKWAKAYIVDNNKLVIYSDEVEFPIAVRYGWSDYVTGNLFNKEGLPATPFRTDTW